jgi:hypothetical protein
MKWFWVDLFYVCLCVVVVVVPCQFRAPCCDKAAQREETVSSETCD